MSVDKDFVLAGHAIFTIQEPNETHHTFRVEHVDASADGRWPASYFVKMLTGPDNENDYTYVGKLDTFTGQVRTTAKSRTFEGTYAHRLVNRILARVWTGDHAAYEAHGYRTHHEGRCGRCGRTLTVPESIESGFGPECIKSVRAA